jgi:hypothetical protein
MPGQVFDPMLKEIHRFGHEEVEPISELSIIEGNSAQIVGERAEAVVIRLAKVRRVGLMWKNIPVEFLNGRFLKNYSMLLTQASLLDCFLQAAKLLTIVFSSDGQVPLKQFIMDNG